MKRLAVSLLPLALMAAAHGQEGGAMSTVPAMADVNAVSPALGLYTQKLLLNELWQRPELSPRDRSIATLSTLIARNQQAGLPFHLELALDNGVTPAEVSELITHLAFYTGWGNAMSAIPVARAVFKARNLGRAGAGAGYRAAGAAAQGGGRLDDRRHQGNPGDARLLRRARHHLGHRAYRYPGHQRGL